MKNVTVESMPVFTLTYVCWIRRDTYDQLHPFKQLRVLKAPLKGGQVFVLPASKEARKKTVFLVSDAGPSGLDESSQSSGSCRPPGSDRRPSFTVHRDFSNHSSVTYLSSVHVYAQSFLNAPIFFLPKQAKIFGQKQLQRVL